MNRSFSPASMFKQATPIFGAAAMGAIALLGIPEPAKSGVLVNNPMLPPTNASGTSGYRTAQDLHAEFNLPGGIPVQLDLSRIFHANFGGLTICPDSSLPVMGICKIKMGRDLQTIFGSTIEGDIQVVANGMTVMLNQLTSQTRTKTFNKFKKNGNERITGKFRTEITQEIGIDTDGDGDLEIPIPGGGEILLRTVGAGQTTIDPSGSQFLVHSFFNLFPEISVNGGPFIRGQKIQVGFVENADEIPNRVPEPSTTASVALVGLGALFVLAKKQRSKKF